MKFSCEKALLQSAIAVTSRAVAQKSSIPALEGLLLHADSRLTISGYNLQTGIRTKVSADVTEPGEIVLNARLFGDIIRRMPDDVVTFPYADKPMVHLSCGDADFDILALSAADFPELPEVEEKYSVSLPEKTLRSMIQQTSFAVSTSASVPVKTTVSAFCDRSRRMAFSSIVPLQTAQPASRSVRRPRKSPSIPAERNNACASARSSAVTA